MYELGIGVAANLETARDFYRQACEKNDWSGCAELHSVERRGKGLEKAEQDSTPDLQKACDANDAVSCVKLGRLYGKPGGEGSTGWWSFGVERDQSRALKLVRRACDLQNGEGCLALASFTFDGVGGVQRSVENAIALVKRACELKSSEACRVMGLLNEQPEGKGPQNDELRKLVPKNPELGATFYKQAVAIDQESCKKNDMGACAELATLYGEGMPPVLAKDPARALSMFRKACSGGNSEACHTLGAMYMKGESGVEKNEGVAKSFYAQACQYGNYGDCR
jgi:TPR repeat protein